MTSPKMYPYGYKINFRGKKEIDEDRAKVVQLIFEKYISGMNRYAIRSYLVANGILRPRGDSCNWHYSMVSRILEDERYIGDDKHPQILTEKIFKKAQQVRENEIKTAEIKKSMVCSPDHKYPFTGFIFCGDCGCVYHRHTSGKNKWNRKAAWNCVNYIKLGVEKCKYGGNIYEEMLEDASIKAYNRLLKDISLIDDYKPLKTETKHIKEIKEINVLIDEAILQLKQADLSQKEELEETLDLLLEKRTALEWHATKLDLSSFQTEKIKQHFTDYSEPLILFDEKRIKDVFEKIVAIEPGKLKFVLINGVEMYQDYIPLRRQVKVAQEHRNNTSQTD